MDTERQRITNWCGVEFVWGLVWGFWSVEPHISRLFPVYSGRGDWARNEKPLEIQGFVGAGDGNRTHDIQLGKLTFYL